MCACYNVVYLAGHPVKLHDLHFQHVLSQVKQVQTQAGYIPMHFYYNRAASFVSLTEL